MCADINYVQVVRLDTRAYESGHDAKLGAAGREMHASVSRTPLARVAGSTRGRRTRVKASEPWAGKGGDDGSSIEDATRVDVGYGSLIEDASTTGVGLGRNRLDRV